MYWVTVEKNIYIYIILILKALRSFFVCKIHKNNKAFGILNIIMIPISIIIVIIIVTVIDTFAIVIINANITIIKLLSQI